MGNAVSTLVQTEDARQRIKDEVPSDGFFDLLAKDLRVRFPKATDEIIEKMKTLTVSTQTLYRPNVGVPSG